VPINFSKVTDNIFRGGKPSESDLYILKNIFKINRIISLDFNVGLNISPYVKSLEIEHIILPIEVNGSDNTINYLKDNIIELLTENPPTYIHCLYGKDRTGLAIMFYRMKTGWTSEQALEEAKKFGYGKGLEPSMKEYYDHFLVDTKEEKQDENELNDIDMVESMRDYFQMGATAPAFNPQQSFAPEMPLNDSSTIRQELTPEEIKTYRKLMFQNIYNGEDILKNVPIPEVGQYDNYSGIRGVGPVENQGILTI
jgi:hypothetical protein